MLELCGRATISSETSPVVWPCYTLNASHCQNWFCNKEDINLWIDHNDSKIKFSASPVRKCKIQVHDDSFVNRKRVYTQDILQSTSSERCIVFFSFFLFFLFPSCWFLTYPGTIILFKKTYLRFGLSNNLNLIRESKLIIITATNF